MSDDERSDELVSKLITLLEFEPIGRALFFDDAQPVDNIIIACFKEQNLVDATRQDVDKCKTPLMLKLMASLLQSKIDGEMVNEHEMRKITQHIDFDSLDFRLSEKCYTALGWYLDFPMVLTEEFKKEVQEIIAGLNEAPLNDEDIRSDNSKGTAIEDCLTTMVQYPAVCRVLWTGDVRRALNSAIADVVGKDSADKIFRSVSTSILKHVASQLTELSNSTTTSSTITEAIAVMRQVDFPSIPEECWTRVLICFGTFRSLYYAQVFNRAKVDKALNDAAKEIEKISRIVENNRKRSREQENG